MTAYDLHNLSPLEFEDISRDLLQRKLSLSLEVFAPGRDGGVDLRHCTNAGHTIIVQCKHYINTGFSGLRAAMVREIPKIRALSPQRYIIATSVQLTLKNKNDLKELLSPFILKTSDIIGLRELNALLRDFPDVDATSNNVSSRGLGSLFALIRLRPSIRSLPADSAQSRSSCWMQRPR